MTAEDIQRFMSTLQMRPADKVFWEIALHLARIEESLAKVVTVGNEIAVRNYNQESA